MLKQYVFVPKRMSTGKACSQVAHATFLALEKYWTKIEQFNTKDEISKFYRHRNGIVDEWRDSGMCVIVLEVENYLRLYDIEKYCTDWNIIHHLYNDESEALRPTCLATGIIQEDKQWMFSKFKLHGSKK